MVRVALADAQTATGCAALAASLAATEHASVDGLVAAARAAWWADVGAAGWLEAFASHPRIGSTADLEAATGRGGALAAAEQAGAAGAGAAVRAGLSAWNARYEARFGHAFIVCAAGRTAESMLAELQER